MKIPQSAIEKRIAYLKSIISHETKEWYEQKAQIYFEITIADLESYGAEITWPQEEKENE